MGTHQPVIWMGDYGFLTIMPQSDKLKINPLDRAVSFSHDDEISTPYYYKKTVLRMLIKKVLRLS